MIQIQTLYLFLAFVVTGILPFISAMEHERRKEIFFYAKSVLYHTFGFKHAFTS
jgi:high-affinity nickel permease